MKNWFRKTIRRDKVEFILPGSTTAFKKMPLCQRDGACLHFGTPLREGQKRRSWQMAVIKPRPEVWSGLRYPADAIRRDTAGTFRCQSLLNQMAIQTIKRIN
jgi:hypothetical protein